MHVHVPKPLHGWREFLGEVGIIVLGVLVALTAEQALERMHWRHEVEDTQHSLGSELTYSVNEMIARVRIYECVESRLDELSAIVDQASESGRLRPLGDIGYPYNAQFPRGVWDGVLASQIATHLPAGERIDLSAIYSDLGYLTDASKDEMGAWSELSKLVGPGRRFDPVEANAVRTALGRARFANRQITLVGIGEIRRISRLPIELDVGLIRGAEASFKATTPHSCMPISPDVPRTYGQAPWHGVVAPAVSDTVRLLRTSNP